MSEIRKLLKRTEGLHRRMAEDAGIVSPSVYCLVCERTEIVDGEHCLRHGWPKCHGATMRLGTPPPAP